MSRIERVTKEQLENSIDHTWIINDLMPKRWKCPHCHKMNTTGQYADEILLNYFKYLEHCGCGYVHCWELKLTEDFKRKVIKVLTGGQNGTTN